MKLSALMPPDAEAGPITALVQDARRRLLTQHGVRDVLWATAIALAGPALLFLLGVDAFPAVLLWAFLLGGLGWGLYHWRNSAPDDYRVAQLLDTRSGSEDQISTAWFFSQASETMPEADGIAKALREPLLKKFPAALE